MHYEALAGKLKGEYTIRLTQEHRVAFTIDDGNKTVSVFLIGGHYPKAKK
jgi:Txe/YoeB family toxin of Txe-Axe toxin-antitoxin module